MAPLMFVSMSLSAPAVSGSAVVRYRTNPLWGLSQYHAPFSLIMRA